MHHARAVFQPLIHCTPPSDPAFLACVSRAYGESAGTLSSDAAILIGTLIRIRKGYPTASIIPLARDGRRGPFAVWLVSREGWTELEVVASAAGGRPSRLLAGAQPAPPHA
jgi:hypothetical protein